MKPEEIRTFVMSVSEYADLLVYSDYVLTKSKGGKKPNKQAWGFTGQYLKEYGDPNDLDKLVQMFTEAGMANEIEAIKAVFRWEDYI